jgi:hypothetical protein
MRTLKLKYIAGADFRKNETSHAKDPKHGEKVNALGPNDIAVFISITQHIMRFVFRQATFTSTDDSGPDIISTTHTVLTSAVYRFVNSQGMTDTTSKWDYRLIKDCGKALGFNIINLNTAKVHFQRVVDRKAT